MVNTPDHNETDSAKSTTNPAISSCSSATNKKQFELTDRRTLLKRAGIAAAGLSIPSGVASAASPEKKRKQEYRKYRRLLKKRDPSNIEAFHRRLEKAGFKVHTTPFSYSISQDGTAVQDSDDISINYQAGDLDISVSIFEGAYSSMGDMNWSIDLDIADGGGSAPYDNATLGWSDNQYLYDGEYHSDNVELRARDSQGAVWRYQDTDLGYLGQDDGYMTVYLQQQGDCNTRHLYGTWEHTWDEISLSSITFGTGGVALVYTDETKVWRVFPEDDFGGTC